MIRKKLHETTCEYKIGLRFLWLLIFSLHLLFSKPHLIGHQVLRDIRTRTYSCHVAALNLKTTKLLPCERDTLSITKQQRKYSWRRGGP